MKLKQVIDLVDDIEPNAYSSETKVAWLNECEGTIQTDIFLRAIDDVELYTWPDDQQTVLLVKPPHDKIYRLYLQAMIQMANAEYDRYQNTMVLYDAAWGEYARWFGRTIYPAGRDAIWRGYYISAYGIAVQHGYHGTPEDWLASLKGETGTGISDITFVRTDAQGGNVYRITLTNDNTYEFTAPKGAAGAGSGDMLAADYDP